jgi:hypothetical protein
LQTAKDLLTSQGIKWFRDNELHFDPPLSERSVGYRVDLYFVQRAEYMQSIQVQSEVLGDPQTNHFAEDWRRYSLDQVLTRYGIPTQIWLGIGPVVEQGAKLGYVLTVVYNEGGFSVSYGGTAISDQLKDQVCPVFDEVDHIILRLQSPQSDDSIFRPDPDAYIRPLEEATKMSVEQFHQSFVQPNSKTCLETPADMW